MPRPQLLRYSPNAHRGLSGARRSSSPKRHRSWGRQTQATRHARRARGVSQPGESESHRRARMARSRGWDCDAFGDRLPCLLERAKAMAESLRLIRCDRLVCGSRLGWVVASLRRVSPDCRADAVLPRNPNGGPGLTGDAVADNHRPLGHCHDRFRTGKDCRPSCAACRGDGVSAVDPDSAVRVGR